MSAAQQREWDSTVFQLMAGAGKRGRDAGFSHTSQAQSGQHWGHDDVKTRSDVGASRRPPLPSSYTSSVRVIKVGPNRMVIFDGPRPNMPRPDASEAHKARHAASLKASLGPTADYF